MFGKDRVLSKRSRGGLPRLGVVLNELVPRKLVRLENLRTVVRMYPGRGSRCRCAKSLVRYPRHDPVKASASSRLRTAS